MNQKIKIMVVDNSRLFRSMLNDALNRYDFDTFLCSTAEKALAQLKNRHYDLICASYTLNAMAGETFCQKIRSTPGTQNTRLILFNAEDNQEKLKQALLEGATEVYCKNQIAQFEHYLQRLANNLSHNISGQILLI